MNRENLNHGFSSPLRFNSRGGTEAVQLNEQIRQSIRVILGTELGERRMRPNFGSNLHTLLFAPNNTGTANLARLYVEEALETWEPRILLEDVKVQNHNQAGELVIQIFYQIIETDEFDETAILFNLQ